ncbi:ATP synthase E chain-domain-containing protein [Apodospora peruviana]|uniref:ATP synthase F(0) complex subunit e, mitochondrial n=1 Tax=Apodospora peruviana TaxID=516989 RepID=A0AAE0IQ85_9PEZI|nr:ATP synthase E chain-domain-containing protein [Apodospora peruviana]
MSTSSATNVLRYTALGLGIFYGFSHQRSLSSAQKAAAAQKEYEHKQSLIAKAKAEFAKSKQPASSASKAGGPITDLTDPKFDLEALISSLDGAKA